MKNKLYNRIVLCGLLGSSLMILGMDKDNKQLTTSKDQDNGPHHQHHGILHTIEHKAENLFEHKTKQPDSPRLSATTQITKTKNTKDKGQKSSSSSSTPMPLNPNQSTAQQHHHHHHHIKKDLEKVEEEIHEFNETVLTEIIQDKKLIAEVLDPIVGEPTSNVITEGIVVGATITQKADNIIHNMVVNFEKEEEAKKQAAQQQAAIQQQQTQQVTPTTPTTCASTTSTNQTSTLQEIETVVLQDVQTGLNVINKHSTIVEEVLGIGMGQPLAQTVVEEIKKETPMIQTLINDLEGKGQSTQSTTGQQTGPQINNNPDGSGSWNLVIGGTAFVVTLAGLIIMLHKYNKLPASIVDLINKLITQKTTA